MNYEEGSEYSIPDGDEQSEAYLTEVPGATLGPGKRDLIVESIYEYGSRAGFWRLMRLFEERGIKITVFGAALALERNPAAADAIRRAGYDVCSHGWRWIGFHDMSEQEEREQMHRAVESIARTIGERPAGWYCRYAPSINTRRLVVEEGGFLYDSDAYNDDLPYWVKVGRKDHLVIPYSLDVNDMKFSRCSRLFVTVRLFRIHARYVRRSLPRRQNAAEDDVGGAAYASGRAPRTRGGARAFLGLRSRTRRRLDLPAHRHRASLDSESSAAMNGQSVIDRLADLAQIGRYDGGIDRALATPQERAARERFAGWARANNYALRQDRVGNVFARRAGTGANAAPILLGSHLDTVRTGGPYDGAYGVTGALCVLDILTARNYFNRASGRSRRMGGRGG